MLDGCSDDSGVLEAVRRLAPEIAAASKEGERRNRLTPKVIDGLKEAGLFRMLLPYSAGGLQLSLVQSCRIIEEAAMADGAAGWTAMVSFGVQSIISRMSSELVKHMLSKGPDILVRGALGPTGKATPTEGGYIINGRWRFASGPYDPDFVFVGCMADAAAEDGRPFPVALVMEPGQVTFLNNWEPVGLCGTDSSDFTVVDQFVPSSRVTPLSAWSSASTAVAFDLPFFRTPFEIATGPSHSAVAIGLARGAANDLIEIGKTKRHSAGINARLKFSDDPIFCDKLGGIMARLASLQALHDHLLAEVTRMADTPQLITPVTGLKHSSWVGFINIEAVGLINDCFTLAGSSPVYKENRLQQRWRDIRCAAQHIASSTAFYSHYGAMLTADAETLKLAEAERGDAFLR